MRENIPGPGNYNPGSLKSGGSIVYIDNKIALVLRSVIKTTRMTPQDLVNIEYHAQLLTFLVIFMVHLILHTNTFSRYLKIFNFIMGKLISNSILFLF